MELIDGIATRRSVRGFRATPVPEALLRQVLQVAGRSPSYTNTQPWEVSVVTGAKRDQLSLVLHDLAAAPAPVQSEVAAPLQWPAQLERRASEHNARRFKALAVERDDKGTRNALRLMNYQFFGAPCVLLLWLDKSLSEWSTFDLGLFTQTLALAAHGVGLGTCLQASLTHYPDVVRAFLGVPESKRLMLGISIGYSDPDAKLNNYQSARANLDEFVSWHD